MSDIRVVTGTSTVQRVSGDDRFIAPRASRDGALITQSWGQALVNEGKSYQVQLGTEDAPSQSTTSIDDILVWAVVDVPTGTAIIPYSAQAVIATWGSSTLVNFLIEIDNAKTRYSSAGATFTPLNHRTDISTASSVTAKINTGTETGVVTTAKTTGGSLEVFRESIEVNVGDEADYNPPILWEPDSAPLVVGPASVVLHLGAASSDVTAYGTLKWYEFVTATDFS